MNIIYYILLSLSILFICAGTVFYVSTLKMHVKDNNDLQRVINTNKKMSILSSSIEWFNRSEKSSVVLKSKYGYNLAGYYIPAKESSSITIILSHGITTFKLFSTSYAQMFHELGFNTFIYDHRRHGDSGGKNISYGFYERYDMETVVEYIKKRNGQDSTIGIHGVSMGSAITLMYAGSVKDNCSFYILDCPYSSMKSEIKYRIKEDMHLNKIFNESIYFAGKIFTRIFAGFNIDDVEPIKYIKNISSPIMIIDTKEDGYIPMEMSKNIYNEKTGPKKIYWVPTGNHAMAYYENVDEYKNQIKAFLIENEII